MKGSGSSVFCLRARFPKRQRLWHHHGSTTLTSTFPIPSEEIGPSPRGRRRGLRVLAFGLMVLGICVFAWGLRYKLSLYDPPQSQSHRVQEAKLLPGRERTALPPVSLTRAADPGAPQALGILTLALWAAVLTGFTQVSACWAPGFPGTRRTPQFPPGPYSFTRPPPSRS